MKKIMKGMFVVFFCTLCILKVNADDYLAPDYSLIDNLTNSSESSHDVMLYYINETQVYSVDMYWGSFVFLYELYYDNQESRKAYRWVPRRDFGYTYPDESSIVYVTNYSSMPIDISFSWNSEIEGLNAKYEYFENNDTPVCTPFNLYELDNTSGNRTTYSDSNCTIVSYDIDEDKIEYYLHAGFDYINDNNSTFRLLANNGNRNAYSSPSDMDVNDEDYMPFIYNNHANGNIIADYDYKFNLVLEGQVNREDLTEFMKLGTLTITLSDIE